MKIFISCPECYLENISSSGSILIEYNDDLVAKALCEKEHEFNVIIQANKFEFFMVCGAEAIVNKYPLEACLNFSMARENLFFFCIRNNARRTRSGDIF